MLDEQKLADFFKISDTNIKQSENTEIAFKKMNTMQWSILIHIPSFKETICKNLTIYS